MPKSAPSRLQRRLVLLKTPQAKQGYLTKLVARHPLFVSDKDARTIASRIKKLSAKTGKEIPKAFFGGLARAKYSPAQKSALVEAISYEKKNYLFQAVVTLHSQGLYGEILALAAKWEDRGKYLEAAQAFGTLGRKTDIRRIARKAVDTNDMPTAVKALLAGDLKKEAKLLVLEQTARMNSLGSNVAISVYSEADLFLKAARVMEKSSNYNMAIDFLRRGRHLKELADFYEEHGKQALAIGIRKNLAAEKARKRKQTEIRQRPSIGHADNIGQRNRFGPE